MKTDFPIFQTHPKLHYLDNAATTQKPRVVLDATLNFYLSDNANPGRGAYTLSSQASNLRADARRVVAEFIHAQPDEIIFTSGCTESINMVAQGLRNLQINGQTFLQPGDEILVTISEHHSNLLPWQELAKTTGIKLRFIDLPVIQKLYQLNDTDNADIEHQLIQYFSPKTKIIAMAATSNVLGGMLPIKAIAKIAHSAGAIIICDAAQTVAHHPINVEDWDVDFLAFSAHKMYAPMGVGVLYGKKEWLSKLPPTKLGGGIVSDVSTVRAEYLDAPDKFEGGTRNVAGEVGLMAACQYINGAKLDQITKHEQALAAQLVDFLQDSSRAKLYSGAGSIVSFNLFDHFGNLIHPHDIATILNDDDIAIRSGHHCAQPLMNALGIPACCRASFGLYNTEDDVAALIRSIQRALKILG